MMRKVILSLSFVICGSQAVAECRTIQECAQEAVETALAARAQIDLAIPQGAVLAFALKECPSPYWEEYEPAYGRVIRGIDLSESGIDPDGVREPASLQGDALQQHTHTFNYHSSNTTGYRNHANMEYPNKNGNSKVVVYPGDDGTYAVETRMRNVALLYCIRK